MYTFRDYYNNEVTLSFADHPFKQNPKHVWVICTFEDKWLLTNHKERGLEFPGGKVELDETAEQGAIREVKEETGGIVSQITYIGQYFVAGKREKIIKNVYYAEVKSLEKQQTYFETEGPILLSNISTDIKSDKAYSFIMKDNILPLTLDYITSKKQWKLPKVNAEKK